ncbi:bifunctional adenosine 5'-phosphosulfate phosphorylase/adenylylsulfatase HINT4-like isoform X1 [Curcuma longa]|uniref:bifunctional adenosine 5'-phosphosulfate phosphorylase/adenylylsulfatase HINT4-like isoform X1 n=1 Tax=Curcuma longa TaxID=136217 RepID=UPI003D9EDA49
MEVPSRSSCLFCQISRGSTSTDLLFSDEMVVAFRDIRPAAFRHYLVIPVKHIPTVKHLYRSAEDHQLVNHMLNVGKILLERDAPQSNYRFGFHQPPFYSVDHLHLHCLALPFIPSWKRMKYSSAGPFGFLEVDKLLAKLRPVSESSSQV